MRYEDALARWGETQLRTHSYQGHALNIDPKSINVEVVLNQGNVCCNDPGCYHSMAEDPSARIYITGRTRAGAALRTQLDDLNLAGLIGELIDVADGVLTK
jgi:hypothetical protein